jgi:hypothetical protein
MTSPPLLADCGDRFVLRSSVRGLSFSSIDKPRLASLASGLWLLLLAQLRVRLLAER